MFEDVDLLLEMSIKKKLYIVQYEIYLNLSVHVFIPAVHFNNSLSETNLYLKIISSNVNSSIEQKRAASLKLSCMSISFYSYDREKLDV